MADTQVNDRLLTVTAAIHERQRRLEKTALYSIRSGTRVLAENTHVLQWRDYLHDETNAAASEREQAFLRSEIDAALARQILQHATTFAGAARANRYAPES